MRSKDRLRLAEAELSDRVAALEAFACRSWDVWNQKFETHYDRIKRYAREEARKLIWC